MMVNWAMVTSFEKLESLAMFTTYTSLSKFHIRMSIAVLKWLKMARNLNLLVRL